MSTVTWSCVPERRRLLSLVLVTMMSCYVTHSVILRPDWFPYFRDGQAVPHAVNTSSRLSREGGHWRETHAPEEEAGRHRHQQLLSELSRYSAADLRSAVDHARSFNCSGWSSGASAGSVPSSAVPAGCYYRYTSLLLRLLQRNFYDAVSP